MTRMAVLRSAVLLLVVALFGGCAEEALETVLTDSDPSLLAHRPTGSPPANAATLALAAPDYAGLDGATAQGTPGSLHLTIDAAGEIPGTPMRSSNPWPYSGTRGRTLRPERRSWPSSIP